MGTRRKFYVVWEGLSPGIYDSWDECKAQVEGFTGARYKSFNSIEEATAAFRGSYEDQATLLIAMAKGGEGSRVKGEELRVKGEELRVKGEELRVKGIEPGAWAVDGACAHNPGPMEYRGVEIATGREIFHVGPYEGGTNNIAEYLALVHALALLDKLGDHTRVIYSDSVTALSWLRRRGSKTKIEPTAENRVVFELLARANRWVMTHSLQNPVLKWQTEEWGEIPADFGRK